MSTMNISRPVPSVVANLTIGAGLKTAVLNWDSPSDGAVGFEVWSNTSNTLGTATLTATVTTNAFSLSGISTSTYFWVRAINAFGVSGVFSSSVLYTPGVITSTDTANTIATSISSGVGGASASGSLSGYNTYVPVCMSTFLASDNSIVVVSQVVTIRCGAKSGSGGIEIWIRTRLRDTTTNTDVPAGSKVFLVYRDFLSIVGQANQFFNVNESYISGFRGLLTPGHNYSLITEISRNQLGGTPTMSLDYDSGTSASGAASI